VTAARDTSPAGTPAELTIDELARAVGMTVRNVRAYASRGLMPAPRLVGRTGYYGEEHVTRLTLVRELLNEGYTLAAVERIVGSGIPAGTNALAVLSSLRTPFRAEQPEVVDRATLSARAGGRDDRALDRLAVVGIVEQLDDDRVRILQPALFAAGLQVIRLGLPATDVLGAYGTLRSQIRGVADVFVGLFMNSVWRSYVAEGMPDERLDEVQSIVERLHPASVQTLLELFRGTMAEAVDEAIGTELARLPRSSDDVDAEAPDADADADAPEAPDASS
jgi:DNA-binding transcriptional MerR regulator